MAETGNRLRAGMAVVAMMALYAVGYAWSAVHMDTADELMRGYEIVHGIDFPLQGPPLGQVLHLGPAWFYLVGLPLLAWHSWLASALFIGLVAGLKFPLAYFCGKRLLDERFGFAWAAALLLPGWPSLEQIVFLNPNGVAAAILAVLAFSLRALDAPRVHHFAGLGLLLALAAHVHPNAAPAALCVIPVARAFRRAGGSLALAALAFVAAFALPFVPYAYLQATSGFPDFQTASRYMHGEITAKGLLDAPAVLVAYLVRGPEVVAEYLGRWPQATSAALGVATAALHAMAAVAALFSSDARIRRLGRAFLAAVAIFALWVGAMRITTPFQFAWSLAPAVAGVLALGLRTLWARPWGAKAAVACVLALVLANVATLRGIALRVEDGEGRFPSLLLDIKGSLPPQDFQGVFFPAWAHDRLGSMLCEAPKPLLLHGHLALLEDENLGLDLLFACRKRHGVQLGGDSSGARHLLGMTRPFWRASGVDPECTVGSIGLSTHMSVVEPQPPIALTPGATYPPRKYSMTPGDAVRTFETPPSAAVLVTNVLDGYQAYRIGDVTVDGQPIAPAATNLWASLYVPQPTAAMRQWKVRFSAAVPEAVDIVVVLRDHRSAGCDTLLTASRKEARWKP